MTLGRCSEQIPIHATHKEQNIVSIFFSQALILFRAVSGRRAGTACVAAILVAGAALLPAAAQASFGLSNFDVTFAADESGATLNEAGAHPYELITSTDFNTAEEPRLGETPEGGGVKDQVLAQIPGLAGNPTAAPVCREADFVVNECPKSTWVGIADLRVTGPGSTTTVPVTNLTPPPGVAARFGFDVVGVPVRADFTVSPNPPYNIVASVSNTTQTVRVYGADFRIWGVPADESHDLERGGGDPVPVDVPELPLVTLPRACEGPLATSWRITSWERPTEWLSGSVLTHDNAGNPQGMAGCSRLGFAPRLSSQLTSRSAETGSGLRIAFEFPNEGIDNPTGIANSDVKDVKLVFPEGMTINPSVAEGLAVCTPAQLARETAFSAPGEGCPLGSKLGDVRVETPLVEQTIVGATYLAEQDDPSTAAPGAENPFDTLIALYLVLQNRELGVSVKLPVKVEPDPRTGRLTATLTDSPQFPIESFEATLRTGERAPLITPPACGSYETRAELAPWSAPTHPVTVTATSEISSGVHGGPCPSGGVPPFEPDFDAGSLNNAAAAHTPFLMRLERADGEQNMTKFSSVLPPGVLGSLAGIDKCPGAGVALARAKTGREELASPSCPPNSEIGTTLAGAGVGEALTYAGGKVYLGGPYKGAPLSAISITPAVAGPFDAGTVVVQLGLDLNPRTAEVEVDGSASDPIPHILQGIVLKVRDLRVSVDRDRFIVNPTSCAPSSAKATLYGSFLDLFDPADDRPVDLATRYQAAGCASLAFKPRLRLNLVGGTRRGANPGLRAHYRPRAGDANTEGLVVRLPRSAFLDQAHIRTICTRVQFAADNCPKAAQYGYIRAWTPLLDEPLQGPVWLRSSSHKLPDLVFDLHGIVDIEVSTRIDSIRGGIRATLNGIPDAPLSRVLLRMQGGKKGLIVNSRDLCARKSRANVRFSGQNGKRRDFNPVMRALGCRRQRKAKRSSHSRAARAARASALR